jgi:hypothetical protein
MHRARHRVTSLAVASSLLWGLAGVATGATQPLTTDKGVVQAASSASIVLRGLDGSTVSLSLGPATVVRLNGNPATAADLRPGLVAAVTHRGPRPARIVRAFGTVKVVERGTVEAVSTQELVLRRPDGSVVTIPWDAATTVRKFGRPARREAVRVGRLARATYVPGSPAIRVAIVRQLG